MDVEWIWSFWENEMLNIFPNVFCFTAAFKININNVNSYVIAVFSKLSYCGYAPHPLCSFDQRTKSLIDLMQV